MGAGGNGCGPASVTGRFGQVCGVPPDPPLEPLLLLMLLALPHPEVITHHNAIARKAAIAANRRDDKRHSRSATRTQARTNSAECY